MDINNTKIQELEKGQLIDCRELDEWNQGHLENAVHAPLQGLILNPDTFLTNGKDQTYYIYCLSGGRANMACTNLTNQGYTTVNIGGVMQLNDKNKLKK